MKQVIRTIVLILFISIISTFPIFMVPIRSIWDEQERDHKKVAVVDETADPD